MAQENEGYWFKDFFARTQRAATSENAKRMAVEVQRAAELYGVEVPQSQANKNNAEDAAALIKALPDDRDSIVQLGNLVIVRAEQQLFVRTLTQRRFLALKAHVDARHDPKAMLRFLEGGIGGDGPELPPIASGE